MSVRRSSHGTIFLIVASGSPRALIASSLRSTSKKPFCPMTRSLHPPMTACGHRVRFVATWREEFFEVPMDQGGKFLARGGKLVNIEGPGPLYSEVKRLTVVEFENMEKAQATFASPSYSDVRTIGNKHAKFRIIGVEGVPQ